jgi:hypothetical protein
MIRRILCTLVVVVAGCSKPPAATSTTAPAPVASPAPAKIPSAEDILAMAVEAAGGATAHDALHSYYSESRMEIASQGLSADSKLWWKKGKFYMEIDMPGVGLSRVWCDGKTVISEDPVNGRRTLEGREATQSRWAASVSLPHEWTQYFTKATTVGRREAADHSLVDVKLSGDDDVEVTLSFDETTHLLHSQTFLQQSPMGAMPVEVAVVEYKPYAGLQQAARTEMRMAIFTAVTTLTKFDANVDIDDAKFTPAATEPPAATPAAPSTEPKIKPKTKAKTKTKTG